MKFKHVIIFLVSRGFKIKKKRYKTIISFKKIALRVFFAKN